MSHSMRADSNRGTRRRRRNRHPDAGEAAVRITAISSKNSKRNYAHASTHIVHCVRAIVGARSTSGCRVVIDFGFSTVVLLRNSMTLAHITDGWYEFHTKKRSIMAPQACETHRVSTSLDLHGRKNLERSHALVRRLFHGKHITPKGAASLPRVRR